MGRQKSQMPFDGSGIKTVRKIKSFENNPAAAGGKSRKESRSRSKARGAGSPGGKEKSAGTPEEKTSRSFRAGREKTAPAAAKPAPAGKKQAPLPAKPAAKQNRPAKN